MHERSLQQYAPAFVQRMLQGVYFTIMCQTVIFAKSGIECETVKELKEALPQLELIKNEMYKEIQDDCCLCQVDLEDTFDKAGLEWERDCMQFTLIAL